MNKLVTFSSLVFSVFRTIFEDPVCFYFVGQLAYLDEVNTGDEKVRAIGIATEMCGVAAINTFFDSLYDQLVQGA